MRKDEMHDGRRRKVRREPRPYRNRSTVAKLSAVVTVDMASTQVRREKFPRTAKTSPVDRESAGEVISEMEHELNESRFSQTLQKGRQIHVRRNHFT
jgi:hypothetical protein